MFTVQAAGNWSTTRCAVVSMCLHEAGEGGVGGT